jgi:hypothetical protein
MNDRASTTASGSGIQMMTEMVTLLEGAPLGSFWEVIENSFQADVANHQARVVIRHREHDEYFNLIQFPYNYEEILVIHNIGETIINADYDSPGSDYYDLQWNTPASAVCLNYPVGVPAAAYNIADYVIVGTSYWVFVASVFDKDGNDFSSQGQFGFLDPYGSIVNKFVGGLPTNNFTFRPHDYEHHYWEDGYQNFSMKSIDGMTWDMQTTYEVHDNSDFDENFPLDYLFPLVYFEDGTPDYSGRIAGEIQDTWYAVVGQTFFNKDTGYLDGVAGTPTVMLFGDGENKDKKMAIRIN